MAVLQQSTVTVSDAGITLLAAASLLQVATLADELTDRAWPAAILFQQCFDPPVEIAPSGATVGSELLANPPRLSLISVLAALDGTILLDAPNGARHQYSIFDFLTGTAEAVSRGGGTALAVFVPAQTLAARTAFRAMTLPGPGNCGAIVIGRAEGGRVILTFVAAVNHPYRVTVDSSAGPGDISEAVDAVVAGDWVDDAHGAADWRRAVAIVMAAEIVEELHPLLPDM